MLYKTLSGFTLIPFIGATQVVWTSSPPKYMWLLAILCSFFSLLFIAVLFICIHKK